MKSGSRTSGDSGLGEGLEYHPLTPERWHDLETLFGKSGASGGALVHVVAAVLGRV